MGVIRSVVMAFSMFSKIPMPRVEWRENSMRYTLCAFPLVGAVVALALWGWAALCGALAIGDLLYAAGCVVLPILLTGGIHLDGLCDTADALCSLGDREKKLAILKDPHIGAFALIWAAAYLLGLFGVFAELRGVPALPWFLGFTLVLSRAVAGFFTAALPNARTGGLAHTFSQSAQRTPVYALLSLWCAGAAAAAFAIDWRSAVGMLAGLLVVSLIFPRMAMRQFGGVTGDLVGFFIQMSELCMLLGILAAYKIGGIP